jgi:hypothetical protein
MSQLVRPRVHFNGTFETNVGTANNDDVPGRGPVVDAASVTVHPPDRMGDEEFRRWMRDRTPSNGPTRPGHVRAGWNYYGDNQCELIDVSVTAIEPLDGRRIVRAQDDPLVGAHVRLGPAVMVDLDPKGFVSTQIFADRLEVFGDNGLRFGGRPSRFHCRWLNLNRNLGAAGFTRAAAVFQASIPNANLDWEVAGSTALDDFRTEVGRGAGMGVRLCVYLLSPRLDEAALAEQYKTGEPFPNPAAGRLVGTLSVWRSGELASVAMGRLLVPSGTVIIGKLPVALGAAVANVDDATHRVTLDVVNTFPEADKSGRKQSLGGFMLRTRHGTESSDIGPVPYDKATYEQTAGIVEVEFDPALGPAIAAGELVMTSDTSGELLAESPVMVESDDRCVYLQQGESATVRFSALTRGAPLAEPVRYLMFDEPSADATGRVVKFSESVEVGTGAGNAVTLLAENPGCTVIRLIRDPSARQLDITRDPYFSVRVLPADDFDRLADDELTFPLIYQEVLRYYHLLHPVMSRRLDLSDEKVVTLAASTLLGRTDPNGWSGARYMPRTRDLSAGKRRLLERWCRKVIGS